MEFLYVFILAFIFIMCGFALLSKKGAQRFLFLSFLLLGIMSGVRYQDGFNDFRNNYVSMIRIRFMSLSDIISSKDAVNEELVHRLFRKLVATVFNDPQWYFILTSLLIIGVAMYFCYRFISDPYLYVILFYCAFSYFTFNNVTRQGVAVSLVTISYMYLLRNKKLGYLFFVILASLIHRSSIIAIIFLITERIKISRQSLLAYFFAVAILAILNKPITNFMIQYFYTDYASSGYGHNQAAIFYVAFIFLAVIMIIGYVNQYRDENEIQSVLRGRHVSPEGGSPVEGKIINRFIVHGSVAYAVFIMLSCMNMLLFARFSLYFVPCFMLCIDRYYVSLTKYNRIIGKFLLILFALAIFITMNIFGKLIPTPYETFWQYPERPTYFNYSDYINIIQ